MPFVCGFVRSVAFGVEISEQCIEGSPVPTFIIFPRQDILVRIGDREGDSGCVGAAPRSGDKCIVETVCHFDQRFREIAEENFPGRFFNFIQFSGISVHFRLCAFKSFHLVGEKFILRGITVACSPYACGTVRFQKDFNSVERRIPGVSQNEFLFCQIWSKQVLPCHRRNRIGETHKIAVAVQSIGLGGKTHFPEIRETADAERRPSCLPQRRKKQRCENRYNRNHDQKFNQREIFSFPHFSSLSSLFFFSSCLLPAGFYAFAFFRLPVSLMSLIHYSGISRLLICLRCFFPSDS